MKDISGKPRSSRVPLPASASLSRRRSKSEIIKQLPISRDRSVKSNRRSPLRVKGSACVEAAETVAEVFPARARRLSARHQQHAARVAAAETVAEVLPARARRLSARRQQHAA